VIEIAPDDPLRDDVHALLAEHLADMHQTSPPESVHALDHGALTDPVVTFWTAREDGVLLGSAARKHLSEQEGEVKSMRTAATARGRGVAATLLEHVLAEARRRGYERVSLETGSQDYFAAARRLYRRHGFEECGPFGDYVLDPHSVFMTRALARG
jgi:putative acetyltransferase